MSRHIRYGHLPGPVDDADDILDRKYLGVLGVRVMNALHNAGVKTVGELRRIVYEEPERLRRTKNLGTVGIRVVENFIGKRRDADHGTMVYVAESLRRAAKSARIGWFRALGEELRIAGHTHPIVDELSSYTEE